MRIFYASHDSGNDDRASLSWYNNIFLALKSLGHEVIRFDHDLFETARRQDFTKEENKDFIKEQKPILGEKLLKQLREAHARKPIDLFFSYFASSYCEPQVIKDIGNMGIVTMNWFCNASYQFYLVKDIAPAYNYCLVPEKNRIKDYKAAGANPVYCQEAANPDFYFNKVSRQDIDISFVGGRYGNRLLYINSLYRNGLPVDVYGANWSAGKIIPRGMRSQLGAVYRRFSGYKNAPAQLFHGILPDKQLVDIYNRSKINLGFTICGDTFLEDDPIKQVRLRDFEIPMSGGFYLTEKNEELADFFEPDKEIVFFEDQEECILKAGFYLKHANLRHQISMAGFQRAQKDHTWQKRLTDVFVSTGLIKK